MVSENENKLKKIPSFQTLPSLSSMNNLVNNNSTSVASTTGRQRPSQRLITNNSMSIKPRDDLQGNPTDFVAYGNNKAQSINPLYDIYSPHLQTGGSMLDFFMRENSSRLDSWIDPSETNLIPKYIHEDDEPKSFVSENLHSYVSNNGHNHHANEGSSSLFDDIKGKVYNLARTQQGSK